MVEGRNLTIEYKLFNVGDKCVPAHACGVTTMCNVTLAAPSPGRDASDLSVSDEYVEALQVLDGDLTYHLDHLPA